MSDYEFYPVRFAYPAYATVSGGQPQFVRTLDIKAQVIGDVDLSAIQQVLFFTMDGKSVTRKVSPHSKFKSNWSFSAICNIENVRSFFREAEGQYIYYRHYTGSEWVLSLTTATLPVRGAGARGSMIINPSEDDQERINVMAYDFDLQIERWVYEAI